jgi:hypothetical protein
LKLQRTQIPEEIVWVFVDLIDPFARGFEPKLVRFLFVVELPPSLNPFGDSVIPFAADVDKRPPALCLLIKRSDGNDQMPFVVFACHIHNLPNRVSQKVLWQNRGSPFFSGPIVSAEAFSCSVNNGGKARGR